MAGGYLNAQDDVGRAGDRPECVIGHNIALTRGIRPIIRRDDAVEVLNRELSVHTRHEKPITFERLKRCYAYPEWAGADFFDGGSREPARGKLWRVGDEPTPFPVYEYELETPV